MSHTIRFAGVRDLEGVACPRLAASTAQALEGGGDRSAAPCLPDRVLCGVRGLSTTRDLRQR